MKILVLKIQTNNISLSVEKDKRNIRRILICQLFRWTYKSKESLKSIKEILNKDYKIEF